ncbi:MAG TPA: TPM domain-containing protein [Vicinamibacterales bacterium]|jgi:putative membrane protein
MFLTTAEADAIDAAVARVESRTGVQVVTAIVGKSDAYVELPWKAFALGASLAACAVVIADATSPEWITARTALLHAVTILGIAAACALLAVFVPPFGRLFLRKTRRDVEVRQYAESLFLKHEMFGTRRRTSVLVFISLFERRIEVLPDVGLHERVSEADWRALVGRITPLLRRARTSDALQEGLTALESLLVEKGCCATEAGPNELPNLPIEEAGA